MCHLGEALYSGMELRWLDNELSAAIDDRVAGVLFDDEGKASVEDILASPT